MKWLLFLCLPLFATELRPWFGPTFQPEIRASYHFQYYPQPFGGETLHSGILSGLISPWPTWSTELEFAITDSTQRGFFFDYGKWTVRYLLMDDVVGDPVSMTVGGSLTFPSATSIRDIGTFHLGSVNLELHTAIGKEITCGYDWAWRMWALGAIESSFQSWPHVNGRLVVERNLRDRHHFQLALLGEVALSGRSLPPPRFFPGYAKIQTRYLDIEGCYTYLIPFSWQIKICYAYRLAAKNTPRRLHSVLITLFYPLSF